MTDNQVTRRTFIQTGAAAVGAATLGGNFIASAADQTAIRGTPSYNPDMEYRRLGATGLWVSAVCLGGHWKRVNEVTGHNIPGVGIPQDAADAEVLFQNRHDVVTRCLELGINYVDACTADEVVAYGRALQGRRDKMYMSFDMWPRCPRDAKYCKADELLKLLETGMKAANVDYVDVWRLVASTPGKHSQADEEEFIKAFEQAKKDGKARFTGASSHGRPWLKHLAETYPQHFQVLLFPYTAKTKELPEDSLFDAVRKHDIGTFGIKPFAGGSLFAGAKDAQDRSARARLAIRYILGNPAITAPIPGLASVEEVDNMAEAIKQRRRLSQVELRELDRISQQMWAQLPDQYQWLKDWEYV
jgi:aryl-alcohol dehydrogenase-like predicted oxidoreductase